MVPGIIFRQAPNPPLSLDVNGESYPLSNDLWPGQRNERTLAVQVSDWLVNGTIEFGNSCEYLMSQGVGLPIVPDDREVDQFGRIFRQPFDREPERRSTAEFDHALVR